MRILYMEDDEDDFIIMRDMLSEIDRNRYSLEWCFMPDDLLTKLSSQKFDLCFLDYHLGSVDGIDILKKIKARGLDVPVIMLTGQGDSEIDQKAMQAGAVDYIVKGRISSEALERIIRYSLSNHKAEKARRETESLKHTKELAAAIAHEFSQPLQALSNYYELMSAGVIKKEYIEKIGKQIQRIAELTKSLRNITGLQKKEYVDTHILDLTRSSDRPALSAKDKILIVDDEEEIRETIIDMFRIRGLSIEGAASGEEAIQLIRKNDYKIIISDVMMGGMNGPEFFEKVRALGNRSVFIFITGYEISDSLKEAASKADGLLTKPVTLEQFFDVLGHSNLKDLL